MHKEAKTHTPQVILLPPWLALQEYETNTAKSRGVGQAGESQQMSSFVDTWMSRVGLCLFGFRTVGFELLFVRIVTDSPFLLKGKFTQK